jgi:hypothetical protein
MNLPDASGYHGKILAVGVHRFNVLAATIGPLAVAIMGTSNQSDKNDSVNRYVEGIKELVAATIERDQPD